MSPSTHTNQTAHTVASVALAGAVLQVLATITLNMAPLGEKLLAAREGPMAYVLGAAAVALGLLGVWVVRQRPMIAFAVFIAWQAIVVLIMRNFATRTGLAYHGEFILYHFNGMLGAVLCTLVPLRWARSRELGPLRILPAVPAIAGTLLLFAVHVSGLSVAPEAFASKGLLMLGTASLLFAWPVALAAFWRRLAPPSIRLAGALLIVPFAVRIGLSGLDGLAGASVPEAWISVLGVTIVLVAAAVTVLLLFPPRVEIWLLAMITVVCAGASVFFYLLYVQVFGNFEGDQGSLIRSLLGFPVPYPEYVAGWKSAGLMVGLMFILISVYASLVSTRERPRGVALALIATSGLGLGTPHLVLLIGAGAFLFIDTLFDQPGEPRPPGEQVAATSSRGEPDSPTLARTLAELAERIGAEPPLVVDTDQGRMTVLRGSLRGVDFDLRLRTIRRRPALSLTVGVPGRDRPTVELAPDAGSRGQRPAHLLSRTHRVIGEPRDLEALGDAPLDALVPFPGAHLEVWPAGAQLELGDQLAAADVDELEALIRSLTRALA